MDYSEASNASQIIEELFVPTFSEKIEVFYQLSFFLVGLPINISALLKTSRKIRRGGAETRLVKLSQQLLISHIIVLLVYGLWRSYWFYSVVWELGDFMCKLYSFMSALPFHLWSNLVAAIALDMLFSITTPLSVYRSGSNRVSLLIAASWILAIICSSPMLVFKGTVDIPGYEPLKQCYPLQDRFTPFQLKAFEIFHHVTVFYIPLIIVIVCYTVIGWSLRKQMAQRKLLNAGSTVTSARPSTARARFLRATIAIIATFVLTWLPYQVLAVARQFCGEDMECQERLLSLNWLQAIIIASTCINPFLYQFGGDRVRSSYNGSTMASRSGRHSTLRDCQSSPLLEGSNCSKQRSNSIYLTVSHQGSRTSCSRQLSNVSNESNLFI